MVTTHSLGFPRIGAERELKFALEGFWKGRTGEAELQEVAKGLRSKHWQQQGDLDWAPVGDFALYDHVLDMSETLGCLPARAASSAGSELDQYFRVARGRSANDCCGGVHAGEMTKWFDTNYHYIVPEFEADTEFTLNPKRLLAQFQEAKEQGVKAKPVIIGPVTYLWLGKSKDGSDKLALLDKLVVAYEQLLLQFKDAGVEWLQIDEPILACELDATWQFALQQTYHRLAAAKVKLLLASYFGELQENLQLACQLPVQGLHFDAVNGKQEVAAVIDWLPEHKVLSLGVISGRNIWASDLNALLDWLEPVAERLGDRLWLAPSCSLMHVPVDLSSEPALDVDAARWLAFAVQKVGEIALLAKALNKGRAAVAEQLAENAVAIAARHASERVHNADVKAAAESATPAMGRRNLPHSQRASLQQENLGLPAYPTTTIGSFPQTAEIRSARRAYKNDQLSAADYQEKMRSEIAHCIKQQELLGLDVLVHGEAERNDMVEYFGEQLAGYWVTRFGWVQSYGSRCVKPPIIYGDVSRPKAMTVEWTCYADSLTSKPVKGMLTGPVTMLNWSFVRDDIPRAQTCLQLALAIREEVIDLYRAGIKVIQIDEPALREGLPLRRSQWAGYLQWAVEAFRIAANAVGDSTQIHTHMCYCEFNDIMDSIAALDADVITIETSRSDMELLESFDHFEYPNDIGPGVYDIHSPNIPEVGSMVKLIQKAAERIPAERLWVNPDCGLKTRGWDETYVALENMVQAAQLLRQASA